MLLKIANPVQRKSVRSPAYSQPAVTRSGAAYQGILNLSQCFFFSHPGDYCIQKAFFSLSIIPESQSAPVSVEILKDNLNTPITWFLQMCSALRYLLICICNFHLALHCFTHPLYHLLPPSQGLLIALLLKYILTPSHPIHRIIDLSMVATLRIWGTPLTISFPQLPKGTVFILILFINSDINSHRAHTMELLCSVQIFFQWLYNSFSELIIHIFIRTTTGYLCYYLDIGSEFMMNTR